MCEYDNDRTRATGVVGIVDAIVSALVNKRIYASNHPRVTESFRLLNESLHDAIDAAANDRVELGIAKGLVIHDGHPVAGASLGASRLIGSLERLGSGGVAFHGRTTVEELEHLIDVLGNTNDAHCSDLLSASELLERRGVRALSLLPPYGTKTGSTKASGVHSTQLASAAKIKVPLKLYQSLFDEMQTAAIEISQGEEFSMARARTGINDVLQRMHGSSGEMLNIARYEQYDAYTFGHSIRVSFLAMNFAKSFVGSDELLCRIGTAALLHDIGKVRVPYDVLQEPGKLSAEQRREIEKHVVLGAELLLEIDDPEPMAVAAAFGHHRNSPTTGYPVTPGQSAVSMATKLIKICDIYEALTANRPYKPAFSPRRAYRIMLDMGDALDRGLLRRFIVSNGLFPTGTRVQLSNGEFALVERQSTDLCAPCVATVATADDEDLDARDRRRIDLSSPADRGDLAIVHEGSERIEEVAATPVSTAS